MKNPVESEVRAAGGASARPRSHVSREPDATHVPDAPDARECVPELPRRRTFLQAAGLAAMGAVCAVPLVGCSRNDVAATAAAAPRTPLTAAEQALVAGARKEGKLIIYTGSEESIVANLSKAYERRYGVSLEYQRLNSNEIQARYTAEAQAGRTVADVVFTGDSELFQVFDRRGWLKPLGAHEVPGLAAWPADFRDASSVIVSVIPYAMAINIDRLQVPKDPADWSLLVSAAAHNGIVTVDAKLVNLLAIAAWDLLLKLNGEDFLRRVGAQQLNLVDSGPSAVQQLASGAAKLYYPCSLTQAQSMIDQGAPIRTFVPTGVPYTGVMSQAAMSRHAAHPNAAKLFLGFMLSDEGQRILNVVGSSPINTPGTSPLRAGFQRPDFASTAADRAKIIQLLRT